MTVEGKMFGLTFHEQWYVLGKGDDFVVVSYIGDTQQGAYDVRRRMASNPWPLTLGL